MRVIRQEKKVVTNNEVCTIELSILSTTPTSYYILFLQLGIEIFVPISWEKNEYDYAYT